MLRKKKKTGKVEVQICIFEVNDEGKANTICPVLWCIDKGRKCLALPKEDDLFEVPVQKWTARRQTAVLAEVLPYLACMSTWGQSPGPM